MNPIVQLTGKLHSNLVYGRRIRQLRTHLSKMIPADAASLLDVGCGDGLLTSLVGEDHPGMIVQGVDVLIRSEPKIEVRQFDGEKLPFADDSFDAVMFVDVLHHTNDPNILIAEAARVARKYVIIKDHVRAGFVSKTILRFMDWVGNRSHGVVLPYNYMTEAEMSEYASRNRLVCEERRMELALYPFPASLVFDGKLHFIAKYRVDAISGGA